MALCGYLGSSGRVRIRLAFLTVFRTRIPYGWVSGLQSPQIAREAISTGKLEGMEKLLRILPDLRCVSTEREPQANQIRLDRHEHVVVERRRRRPTKRRTMAQKYIKLFTVD